MNNMKGNNCAIYKIVHSDLYSTQPNKESKPINYKQSINDLLRKLSKKKTEATETETSQPKTLLKGTHGTYNQYLTLTKTDRFRQTDSHNNSLSQSHSTQKPVKIEHGSKAKELCSMINACVNHDFTFTTENTQVLNKIAKTLRICPNLNELLQNDMVVDHMMRLICKYIFRKPNYKSKKFV
jgi:hypothetical protein